MSGPIQLPDPLQPARSLTDLLPAVAALLASAASGRSNKFLQKSVVSWSQFTLSFAHPQPAASIKFSRSASPCGASSPPQSFRSLIARVHSVYLQVAVRALPTSTSPNQPFSMESKPSCTGAPRGSSVRVLDLSPDCRSTAEVMPRWLGLGFSGASLLTLSRYCVCSCPHRQRRGWFFFDSPSAET